MKMKFTNPNKRGLDGWHHEVSTGEWKSRDENGSVLIIETDEDQDTIESRMAESYPASNRIDS